MSRELLQQALDALNTCDWDYDNEDESYKTFDEDLVNAAAAALKEALAEPEQEPVRWFQQFGDAPPRKPWVGLTEEDVDWILGLAYANDMELIKTIEAKLKGKNSVS
jgi:hypothetical protein